MGCIMPSDSDKKSTKSDDNSSKNKKRKLVMIGLDHSGKSTILQQMKTRQYQQTAPTLGLDVETVQYKDLEFLIFDIGGKVTTLWSHYYDNLDGLIFVIDSTDRKRIYQVKDELIKLNQDIKFQQCVVLCLFNKQDLQNCMDYQSLLDETGVNQVIDQDVIVQKCSAKTGEGLFDGLDKLNYYFTTNQCQSSSNFLNDKK